MSMALTLAMYLLCCRETGEAPIFPGNKLFFQTADDCSYAPSIADMSVWASTHKHTGNEAFNHNNGDVFLWKYFWPQLGQYFGMDVSALFFLLPFFTAMHKRSYGIMLISIRDTLRSRSKQNGLP